MSRALFMRPGAGPGGAWAWPLRFGLAFFALNTLLTFENRWPGVGVAYMPRLSFELCVGLALLTLWVAWRGALSARAASLLAIGFVALVALRYVDVTAPAVMGRPVHVYWDGRHLAELFKLAVHSWPLWQTGLVAAMSLLGGLLLLGVVRAALVVLAQCVAWPAPRPWLLAGVGALTLSFAAYVPDQRDTRWFFSLPLTPTLIQQSVLLRQLLDPERSEAVLGSGPDFDTDLSALRDEHGLLDMVVLFAESYGATTLDNAEHAAVLRAPRQRLADAVERSGRAVVSGRVRAATFGGASWLSHASLLSGIDTSDPALHSLLLTTQRPTLVRHFAQHGYRTVGWKPGIKRPWPEGAFYGFDRLADDAGMGYLGPDFGYWRIPDQAAMALLTEQELLRTDAPRPPVFAVFPTITSHAPFHPLPPVLPDAAGAASANAYSQAQADAAMSRVAQPRNPVGPYLQSMSDQFDWLALYLEQHAPRRLVVLIVGDHQPPGVVNGRNASWDVPVHVITAHAPLLRRFESMGFVPGLTPSSDTLAPMHGLTQMLLHGFDQRIDIDQDSAKGPAVPAGAAPDKATDPVS